MKDKDCPSNFDPLRLVREGTSQQQRRPAPLAPESAAVNGRRPEHSLVFARAYAAYLRYYNSSNVAEGDWQRFFAQDVSAQLALAAVQEVDPYKTRIQEFFHYLHNLENELNPDLRKHAGYLFSALGSLAFQFEELQQSLPREIGLKASLQNLISSQLAPAFRRLVAYYRAGKTLNVVADEVPSPEMLLFGQPALSFQAVLARSFSAPWITDEAASWPDYLAAIAEDQSVYGTGASLFDQVNHLATHNLFTGIFEQFLKVFARVVAEARAALEKTFTGWDHHEPHYALLLAFVRLMEHVRQQTNTLTQRHLDFYYRDILRLKEKPAQPGQAHLLVELARQVEAHLLPAGENFKAGKDALGKDVFFASDRDLVVNQARVTDLKKLYRHQNKDAEAAQPQETLAGQQNRLFAAPLANSDDGASPEISSPDKSWHPFFNKIYEDGKLTEIRMPWAEVGFALASHYLLLAEGSRQVSLEMEVSAIPDATQVKPGEISCWLSTAEGWLQKTPTVFSLQDGKTLKLELSLVGDDPAIRPYQNQVHGYGFDTQLPVLLVKIRQDTSQYLYPFLQDATLHKVTLDVAVAGLKSLAVSNDLGPVDISQPFQPFGPAPLTGSSLVIGSKEVFQKQLSQTDTSPQAQLHINWLVPGVAYSTTSPATPPNASASFLKHGTWEGNSAKTDNFSSTSGLISLDKLNEGTTDIADLAENSQYQVSSRNGFLRLSLLGDFGHEAYQTALRDFLIEKARGSTTATEPSPAPKVPVAGSLTLDYNARQTILLNSAGQQDYDRRQARFFHLAPFGQAEQHPYLRAGKTIFLLPQFDFQQDSASQESEAECYIGLTGLRPPQQLSLLFQVADGTADPLAPKPKAHLHWSFMHNNEWVSFQAREVEDQTAGLLRSGIVTLAIPRQASAGNTWLPAGRHWIRVAVARESAAVCRLVLVGAQALVATFRPRDNDPGFAAQVLAPGSISKLDLPDSAIKKVDQPFSSFGGRGQEAPDAFYTRVSERLRHKDRALALWDYERLVLEAFPQVYQVKCLNHTWYDQQENAIIYQELAPGHVTLVTIPGLQNQAQQNPLRPFTPLGLLEEIGHFLRKKLNCFVQLHVRNPLFEEVRVSFKVRLREGFDETFYTNQLQQAITRFLSPWAFAGGGSPSFGGKIYQSVLINFVEEQPYVDYVTDFALYHEYGGKSYLQETEVAGSTAVSILVSAPAKKHSITILKPAEAENRREKCSCEA